MGLSGWLVALFWQAEPNSAIGQINKLFASLHFPLHFFGKSQS